MNTAVTTQVQSEASITIDQFKKVLPEKMRKSVNPEILKTLNDMLADPDMCEAYRDNLLGYTTVMNDGKFKLEGYVFAVKYVSYKLMGCTNIDAFTKTFPDKIARWNAQNVASKDIASYVTAYNKSKLVNLILEQTLIPTHVLNADIYQKAINVQADLMMNAQSEKVRCDAADSLLNHLKAPEKVKLQIENTMNNDTIAALRQSVEALRDAQLEAIRAGAISAKEVAASKMDFSGAVEGEIVDAS